MRRTLDHLYLGGVWLAALFILAICLLVATQVGLNLADRVTGWLVGEGLGWSIPSYADFTGFFLAAASFLALAYTLRSGGHIRVTLLLHHVAADTRRRLELFCLALAAGVSGYAGWYTARLVRESYTYQDLSPGIVAVPVWIPQSAMLLGLVLLTIALLDELVTVWRGRAPSYLGEGEGLLLGDDKIPRSVVDGE